MGRGEGEGEGGEIVRLNLIPFSPLYQRKFLLDGERERERLI